MGNRKKNKPSVEIEEIALELRDGRTITDNSLLYLISRVEAIIEYLDREYEKNKDE
jgi:hypothetical protein